MERKTRAKTVVPIVLVFLILNALFAAGKTWLERWSADQRVLLLGNTFLAVVTLLSFALAQRGLKNSNPHAFVRGIFSSMLLKFFVCIVAAAVYIALYKKNLNKPAFFTLMGLYLVYTFLEVRALTNDLKQQKNA